MMQNKLGSLVGRSSGYIESLPASVRRRVAGLKGVQKEHSKLEALLDIGGRVVVVLGRAWGVEEVEK